MRRSTAPRQSRQTCASSPAVHGLARCRFWGPDGCYAERVEEAAAGDGAPLLAHCYTRYLGDLSGGQIIGRRLEMLFGKSASALVFTAFPGIDDINRFADDFRASLDRAGRRVADPLRILDEAQVAFRMNIDISIEALTTTG